MSSNVAMGVGTFVNVAIAMSSNTSILLRAKHGVGKSQLVRQVAKKLQKKYNLSKYEVIDQRLSQKTEGDIIGLPSTDGCVTRFNPPDWYKKACDEPCVLFLDELNRATTEVMQAAFQIVLDRELNGWKLHPQTRVFSAINSSAEYIVNEMDPALLDRFWTIDLEPTFEEWIDWARSEDANNEIHPLLINFLLDQKKFLDTPAQVESGNVSPSRRSWHKLSMECIQSGAFDNLQNDLIFNISKGFVGVEAALAFTKFCRENDNIISGKDIVEDYKSVTDKLKKVKNKPDIQNGLIEKVTQYIGYELKAALTEDQGKNLGNFMKQLPKELRVVFWKKVIDDKAIAANVKQAMHKYCTEFLISSYMSEEETAKLLEEAKVKKK